MQRLDLKACLFASLPPLFWSGNFLIARIMRDQIPPFQMSFWRWTLAFRTGMFMYLLPVYGSIFGITFFGEAVYVYRLLGIVMIFAGMVLVTRTI